MDTRPIGIIDSGSGGLSVWSGIVKQLPYESILYVGDHAHAPYSDKSRGVIRLRMKKLISHLIKNQCKLCIVACNTATVAGIDWYRKRFPEFPIIGVVPVIKTAASITKTKNICILSTKFTANSMYVKKLIKKFAPDATVFSLGSSQLVSYIEAVDYKTERVTNELIRMCKSIAHRPVDVVVLGCTHYPFVRNEIQSFFGPTVQIIDSADAVSRQTRRIIENNAIASNGKPVYTFFTTGEKNHVSSVISRLLGRHIVVEHLPIP